MRQHMLQTQQVTEDTKQCKLRHWCFCGPGQEEYGIACSNKPNGAWDRIARETTQIFEEASHPIFHCAELFSTGDVMSKRSRQTVHFQSTTQTKTIIFHTFLACSQLCIYAAVCDWFDRCNRNQEDHRREGLKLATAHLTKLAHRKGLTASGNRMRDNEVNCKIVAEVSQEAGVSTELGKKQCFVTRLSLDDSEGSTLVRREFALPPSDRNSHLLCALKINVHIGPIWEATTTYLAGLHSIEVLMLRNRTQTCSWVPIRWWFESRRLSSTRFGKIRCWRNGQTSLLAKKILTARRKMINFKCLEQFKTQYQMNWNVPLNRKLTQKSPWTWAIWKWLTKMIFCHEAWWSKQRTSSWRSELGSIVSLSETISEMSQMWNAVLNGCTWSRKNQFGAAPTWSVLWPEVMRQCLCPGWNADTLETSLLTIAACTHVDLTERASMDTVRGCFRHWKHTARLRQEREWAVFYPDVQEVMSSEWVYWLWQPVSLCPGTQGDKPNNVWSDLKHVRAHGHGEFSDPWSELWSDVVLQEVHDQHNLYVRSRAPACSERAHGLRCFQSLSPDRACDTWLEDPQVIWKSVHLMIHWSLSLHLDTEHTHGSEYAHFAVRRATARTQWYRLLAGAFKILRKTRQVTITEWSKKEGHDWKSNSQSGSCTFAERTCRKNVHTNFYLTEMRQHSEADFEESTAHSSTRAVCSLDLMRRVHDSFPNTLARIDAKKGVHCNVIWSHRNFVVYHLRLVFGEFPDHRSSTSPIGPWRRNMLAILCDHWCLQRSVLLRRLTCNCPKILRGRCILSTHTDGIFSDQKNAGSVLGTPL